MTRLFAVAVLVVLGWSLLAGWGQAETLSGQQASCTGRQYRIQPGDSWSRIAQRTGVTVAALRAANPTAAQQPQGWLLTGQTLCIPAGSVIPATPVPAVAPGEGAAVTVRRGDSWAVLAARYGLSVFALQNANPQLMRAGEVLRPGDQVRIPASAVKTDKVPCPATFDAAPAAAAQLLTEYSGLADVLGVYLARCGLLNSDWGAAQSAPLLGDASAEVVAVLADLKSGGSSPLSQLIVLGSGDLGWNVLYQSGIAAGIDLLHTGDLNDDGHADVAWSDTTCGAQACFTTVHIASHVDGQWTNWLDGNTTQAAATARFGNVLPEGAGQELVVSGDVIGAVKAGPQRAVTETWASLAGAPYVRTGRDYAPSFCLYHRVLDGNSALAEGQRDNFAQAIAAYRSAADDPTLVACWTRDNEVEELQAFALYRLAVAYAYAGDLDRAAETVQELIRAYPDDSYARLAQLWWIAYETTRDASASCAVANTFAARHPDAWERLADFGYANPGFDADSVCPIASED